MFTYRNRNTFFQNVHPFTVTLLIITYLIIVLKLKNPIYIGLIFTGIISAIYVDGSIKDVLSYGKIMIPFAIMLMLLNPIIVHNGETVLYQGHINIPVLGTMRITKEAIMFGIDSGFRMIVITIIFGFGNLIIHPDRMFGFFSKYLKKSSLLMSMTIRLFPTMMKSYENIIEVEKLRGNSFSDKKFRGRIKSSGYIANILFLSSLEDSEDMAESMNSRGYGAFKKRSSYFREKYTVWDGILILICGFIIIYTYWITAIGLNTFEFYNQIDSFKDTISKQGIILCLSTFIPTFINWWWKNWK